MLKNSMRIGVNCLNVDPSYRGGVNSFLFGLLHGLANMNERHEIILFVKDSNAEFFNEFRDLKLFRIVKVDIGILTTLRKIVRRALVFSGSLRLFRLVNDFLFRRIDRVISQNCDVLYIATTNLDYYSYRVPTVLSMHDIQHCHYPEFFSFYELQVKKVLYNLSAQYTDFFQASSTFIKDDLLTNFNNLRSEQIKVINEGVDFGLFNLHVKSGEVRGKYSLPPRFLFFPAQLWKHKNHITVLKALNILKAKGIEVPLVLTGDAYSASQEIFDYISQNDLSFVYYLGKVPIGDLCALYKEAEYLITGVLYESSSLPILESAACGTPIIASDTPPNRELGAKLELDLFSPLNEKELAELIERRWLKDMVSKQNNIEYVRYYCWDNISVKYLRFFESVYKNKFRKPSS